jgi:hypothetical protein
MEANVAAWPKVVCLTAPSHQFKKVALHKTAISKGMELSHVIVRLPLMLPRRIILVGKESKQQITETQSTLQ